MRRNPTEDRNKKNGIASIKYTNIYLSFNTALETRKGLGYHCLDSAPPTEIEREINNNQIRKRRNTFRRKEVNTCIKEDKILQRNIP